jgi:type VI secretion system secreted protein Hcp
MAMDGYMTIKGQKQGDITKGANSVKSAGLGAKHEKHENELTVYEVKTKITNARDPKSGQTTGTRIHHPVTFLCGIDRTSPMLWQALATGETLQVSCKFYRPDTSGMGEPEEYFQMEWENCKLCEGEAVSPSTIDPNNDGKADFEQWSFTYEKVRWKHLKDNTEGEDSWQRA